MGSARDEEGLLLRLQILGQCTFVRRQPFQVVTMEKSPSLNVLGGSLQPCSIDPVTGYFRNGCCDTGPMDIGSHTVCVVVTAEFLAYSKYLGNDLSTPMPRYQFRGLMVGDQWCLCAERFMQAHDEGVAPLVALASPHQSALKIVPLDIMRRYAVEPTT
jgi:uncharacterized protein (DUF2237 family)